MVLSLVGNVDNVMQDSYELIRKNSANITWSTNLTCKLNVNVLPQQISVTLKGSLLIESGTQMM